MALDLPQSNSPSPSRRGSAWTPSPAASRRTSAWSNTSNTGEVVDRRSSHDRRQSTVAPVGFELHSKELPDGVVLQGPKDRKSPLTPTVPTSLSLPNTKNQRPSMCGSTPPPILPKPPNPESKRVSMRMGKEASLESPKADGKRMGKETSLDSPKADGKRSQRSSVRGGAPPAMNNPPNSDSKLGGGRGIGSLSIPHKDGRASGRPSVEEDVENMEDYQVLTCRGSMSYCESDSDDGDSESDLAEDMLFVDAEDPEAALQEYQSLHPIVRVAREEAFCNSLEVCDLTKSPRLLDHFKKYSLSDFFDDRGQRRYQNLSLSFAAKQMPDAQHSAVHIELLQPVVVDEGPKTNEYYLSARSYRLAQATVQRDRDKIKQQNQERYHGLDEYRRVQFEDVRKRQQEMLFLEVANYEKLMPPGIEIRELLPLDISRTEEREERRRFEKLNGFVLEVATKTEWPGQGAAVKGQHHPVAVMLSHWILKKDNVFELLGNITSWSVAAAGTTSLVGVDRSVFCRFILDLGLVDQSILPYVWAVSVFDQLAKPVRTSGCLDSEWSSNADNSVNERVAFAPQLSKFDFIYVMDTILRCRFARARINDTMAHIDDFLNTMRRVTNQLSSDWQEKETEAAASAAEEKARAAPLAPPPSEAMSVLEKANSGAVSGTTGTSKVQSASSPVASEDEQRSFASESMVWKRNRLINGMLSEPEVLQVIEQFRPVFEDLFILYTEDQEVDDRDRLRASLNEVRHMEFASFAQVCSDFHIMPRLATMHELLRSYRWAECVEPPSKDDRGKVRNMSKESGTSESEDRDNQSLLQDFAQLTFQSFRDLGAAFVAFDIQRNGEITMSELKMAASRIGFTGDCKRVYRALEKNGSILRQQFSVLQDYVADEGSRSPDQTRGHGLAKVVPRSNSMASQVSEQDPHSPSRRQATKAMSGNTRKRGSFLGSISVDTADGAKGKSTPHGSPRGQTEGGPASPLADSGKLGRKKSLCADRSSVGPDEITGLIPQAASKSPTPQPAPKHLNHREDEPTFGVAAFAETLCRIGLTYLLVHGNSVQLAASSRAKTVWILAYLQAALEQLRQSVDRRVQHQQKKRHDAPEVSRRLARIIERLSPAAFSKLHPMVLQSDSYNPILPVEPIVVAVPDSVPGKSPAAAKKNRRPSRPNLGNLNGLSVNEPRRLSNMKHDLQLSDMVPTRSARGDDESSNCSRPSIQTLVRSSSKSFSESGSMLKNACRPILLQNMAARKDWKLAHTLSEMNKTVKDGKEIERESPRPMTPLEEKRRVTPKRVKLKRNRSMGDDMMDEKLDSGPKKDDIVQLALNNRPPQPELKDDNFKFDDLLFKKLLQKVSVSVGKPTNGVSICSKGLCEDGSIRRRHSKNPSGREQNHADQPSQPRVQPALTLLAKDRGKLLKGLSTCVGKLDRCEMTPPPLSEYAVQLNERIEQMMSTSPLHDYSPVLTSASELPADILSPRSSVLTSAI